MQRTRNLVSETPNSTLAIVVAGLTLILFILLPRVFPTELLNIQCSTMANTLSGGNNGSILAARSTGLMTLQLDLSDSNISVNEALRPNVTFLNPGVGSNTLFLVPQEALLRADGSQGLHFVIRRMPDGAVFGEPGTVRPSIPVRQTFAPETLHVLSARQECTESFEFTAVRLSSLGLQPGNYTMQAVYNNPFPGQWNVRPDATATPIFADQGVYVANELRSNSVEFSIGLVDTIPAGEAQPLGN